MKVNLLKVIIFGAFLFFATSLENVSARACEYGMPTPSIYYNGSWAYGQVVDLHTSANSCQAKNISVYFNQGAYIYLDNLFIEAWLMENDQDPNEDEVAKKYLGHNHTLDETGFPHDEWNWTIIWENDQNLDSSGDQKCELYLKFRVPEPIAQNGYFKEDLLRYTICVD